jgi:glycosyltransferase involved in cell wall biosynthesis
MKRLHVLHITPMYPTAERPAFGAFVKSQVESIRDRVEVEVFVLPGGQGIAPYVGRLGALRRKLFEDHDIVHVHYGNVSSLVKMLRRPPRIVTSYCGTDLLGTKTVKSRLFRPLNRELSRYDDLSIVKSEELAREIDTLSPRVTVLPNGVDTDLFRPMDPEECRRRLGIDSGRPVVLFGANPADKNKNFPLIRDAIRAVGEDRFHLITLSGLKVPRDDMPLYLNASHLVVLTSLHEGSPNVVKEAMACDRPIYATDCGDVRWLFDGVTGTRVLSHEQEAWTRAMAEFLAAGGEGPSNGRRALIEKQLDLGGVASRLVALYQDIAT